MAGEPGHVARSAARWPAGARGSRRATAAPGLVVAHERDAPLRRLGAVCGLAMSWSSAPRRSACPRVSSLASGARGRAAARSDLAPNTARVAPQGDRLGQHGPGVAEHVEMVEAALLDPGSAASSGSTTSVTPSSSISSRPSSARASAITRELSKHPLGRDAVQAGGAGRGQARRLGLDGEAQLAGEAGQPEHAQRVARERPGDTARRRRGGEVGQPAGGVDQRVPAAQRLRDRVDGQIAPAAGRPRSFALEPPSGRPASCGREPRRARRRRPPRARRRSRPRRWPGPGWRAPAAGS